MKTWDDGWTEGFLAASYLFAGYYDVYAELRDERFARHTTESRESPRQPGVSAEDVKE